MKLLFCIECEDVIRLFDTERTCKCGKTKGRYTGSGIPMYHFKILAEWYLEEQEIK